MLEEPPRKRRIRNRSVFRVTSNEVKTEATIRSASIRRRKILGNIGLYKIPTGPNSARRAVGYEK